MNKNLLRVIVYGSYILVVAGLAPLMNQIIPVQDFEFFTAMGMVRFVIYFLIIYFGAIVAQLILRKYGAQFTVSPRERTTIVWIGLGLMVILSSFWFIPYLFNFFR